jgi:MFS transporter, putative metabolite:H+ symporter
MANKKARNPAIFLIIVAALGYFVDIYDLVLFNVVKIESLKEIMIGASKDEIKNTGQFLFGMQMLGMLIGGILWGIWGDKKGRLTVLFGSILLYSIANIANAFVTDVNMYAFVRIIAGIGLAGELGAGITLVAETMSKENRGYGTMIIVTFGALGAVVAAVVGMQGEAIGTFLGNIFNTTFANWQVAYLVGGGLGLMLLLLRIGTIESGMFKKLSDKNVKKGDIRILFSNKKNALKYLYCILVGLPIWFIIGLLVAMSEEVFAKELNIQGKVVNGEAIKWAYIGLSIGDLLSGLISQFIRSRRKVVFLYLGFSLAMTVYFLFFANGITADTYYMVCFLLGTATGYWAIFVTMASEQFGTNIRSTVTNTVPNFVRGSVPLMQAFNGFLLATLAMGSIYAAFTVGIICMALAFFATWKLKETFSKDLDYTEA